MEKERKDGAGSEASPEPKTALNTHDFLMKNGKHNGERITRVPVSYLRWMVNERHQDAEYAAAELKRRGTTMPTLELSGHAIDRASLRCRKLWHETAENNNEGLHAWLMRVAQEARNEGDPGGEGVWLYLGMKFVFAEGEEYPVLKSVMPKKVKADEGDREWEQFADVDGDERVPW